MPWFSKKEQFLSEYEPAIRPMIPVFFTKRLYLFIYPEMPE
jgi:hypothetical protein